MTSRKSEVGSREVDGETAGRLQEDGQTARREDGKTARRGDACVARVRGTQIAGESTRQHTIDPATVEIWPEPSPFERAAILIALEQMLGSTRRDEAPGSSAWALAGRREALFGGGVGSRMDWGGGSARLAGW